MAHVTISTNKGRGEIHMDGRKLHGITGYTVKGAVHNVDEVELSILAIDGVDYETGDATVTIPAKTAETLVALGWTPPEDKTLSFDSEGWEIQPAYTKPSREDTP